MRLPKAACGVRGLIRRLTLPAKNPAAISVAVKSRPPRVPAGSRRRRRLSPSFPTTVSNEGKLRGWAAGSWQVELSTFPALSPAASRRRDEWMLMENRGPAFSGNPGG